MALFKSDEEKFSEEKNKILDKNEFNGRVGQIHQGLSEFGLWGVMDNGKTKFKSTKFKLYDDKIMIERNRNFIKLSDIKEIFQETDREAIIISKTDDAIPIKGKTNDKNGRIGLKAFVSVLNELIEKNKSNTSFKPNNINSEDKFDKLIKLGEMHGKGLLSDEEFASLKQELLARNNENTSDQSEEDVAELSENVCENCGTEVAEDSVFCAECGTKIK